MEVDKRTIAHHAPEGVEREERHYERKEADEQAKGYRPKVLRKG